MSDELTQKIRSSEGFLKQIGKGSGWLPQPEDTRDYKASALLKGVTAPSTASLAKFTPPIRDQGMFGACTGFSTAYAVGLLRRKESDGPGDFNTVYSPAFIYNNAREAIGEIEYDDGAYIRDAVGSVRKIGAATEKSMMYYEVEDILFKPVPKTAIENAKSWRLGAHYACKNLDEVKKAISAGYPVVFGFICYSNIGQSYSNGLIPMPRSVDYVTGGHAVMADSYDDASRTVSGPNSWGKMWGDEGRFHLPYDYFLTGRVMDMWALQGEAEETKFPRRAA